MKSYAKQILNGEVVALFVYDYSIEFLDGSDTVLISKEEYDTLLEELKAKSPQRDPNQISDSEALRIITGGGV